MNWIRNNVKQFLTKSLEFDESLNLTLPNISNEERELLKLAPGGWSIDQPVAEALIHIIKEKNISKVVEIGAGFSSIIFHSTLIKTCKPYEIFSIEENVHWFKVPEQIESFVDSNSFTFNTGIVQFSISHFGIHASYKISERKKLVSGVELVFIDGPQYYFGREGGLDEIYHKLSVGCLIVMDDADRYTEHCVIYKWLKVYQGLDLIYFNVKFGEKGLAVLKVVKPLRRRFSIDAFSLGLMQGIRRLANIRKIRGKQSKLKFTANY